MTRIRQRLSPVLVMLWLTTFPVVPLAGAGQTSSQDKAKACNSAADRKGLKGDDRKTFMQDCPTVNVHVEYRRANEVYDDVLSNIVDLGLVAYPSPDSKLEVVPLRKDALFLTTHPLHPLAKLKTIKIKALSGQKFINFEKDIPTRKALDKIFKDHGVSVNNVMEFDNVETVKRAVEIDSGVAILPEETIRGELANKTLAAVRLDGKFFRELAVIYKKGKVLSPAMKQFIELLKKSL